MTPATIGAALAVGVACASLASVVWRPTRRLAPRVRPYAVVARSSLGLAPDAAALTTATSVGGVLSLPLRALLERAGRAVEQRSDEHVERLLAQAGLRLTVPDYRVRQVAGAAVEAVAVAVVIGSVAPAPAAGLLAAGAGFVHGVARSRRRVERAIDARAARLRQELSTVNHLLAMHVRTGSGPMQAVRRVVERGRGTVVDELRDALFAARHGVGEADAFRAAAARTPEPGAARTYQVLAAGVERGGDLAGALLALSEDIRDARREAVHKEAVRRRAAMLMPTIGILAPIMLLFIAAPLPSIVLGHR